MQRLHYFGIALLTLFVLGCSSSRPHPQDDVAKERSEPGHQIENGLYLVVQAYPDTPGITQGHMVVQYSHAFLDSNTAGQPMFVEIDTSEFVRFDLAETPEGIEQPDKRINLMVSLTDAATIKLANFTGKHLNKRVAIVIGGKVVTIHTVKARINDGKLQITRCTDDACRYLLMELKENVKS